MFLLIACFLALVYYYFMTYYDSHFHFMFGKRHMYIVLLILLLGVVLQYFIKI